MGNPAYASSIDSYVCINKKEDIHIISFKKFDEIFGLCTKIGIFPSVNQLLLLLGNSVLAFKNEP